MDHLHSLDSVCDHLKDIPLITGKPTKEIPRNRSLKSNPNKPKKQSKLISFEYNNYCSWALSLGFVVQVGDDKSNVLEINNRYYLFDSEESLSRFQCEPEKYLLDIVRVLYDRPEFMLFLDRYEEFSHMIRVQEQKFRKAFYSSKDTTSQTEQAAILPFSAKVNAVQEIRLLRRMGYNLAHQVNYSSNTSQTEADYNEKCCMSTQTNDLRSRYSQTAAEKGIQTE